MTSENFKLLTDKQHIRLRFNMYGGSNVVQSEEFFIDQEFKKVDVVGGLLKVINEIIDNSIDEHVRTKGAYAQNISVKMKDGIVEVEDDGRGIPVKQVETPDGKKWQAVTAFTHARAGSNFDDDNRDSIGMNGVGSMITFVTSDLFEVKSGDGTNTIHMKSKNANVTSVKKLTSNYRGTHVKFKPDLSFFNLTTLDDNHISVIENRVKTLALAFPNIRFKFNGRVVKANNKSFFGEAHFFQTDKAEFGIRSSSDGHKSFSIVNGLSVKAGSHIDYFIGEVIRELREMIKKRKKIDLTPAKIKQHLTVFSVINGFKALKFDSQTKERVTNSAAECKDAIGSFDALTIARKLFKDQDLMNEIVAVYELQQKLAAKKDLDKLEKKQKIKSDKFFAAVGETKRIFVVEGDSASGGLIKCLGRKNQAFYALKGVPLNVLDVSHQKFMANKELSELYTIITTFPDAELIVATDADADGSRIRGLLILFMHKYFPEHFDENKVRILRTPLAIGKKKNVVQEWAYTFAEVNNLNEKLDISYVKGLGSWSEKDLKLIIEKETLEKMLPTIKIDQNDLLQNWFSGSTSDFRKDQIIEAKPFDIQAI